VISSVDGDAAWCDSLRKQKTRHVLKTCGFDFYDAVCCKRVVPGTGIEPVRLAARDFESRASTYSAIPATRRALSLICPAGATLHAFMCQRQVVMSSSLNRDVRQDGSGGGRTIEMTTKDVLRSRAKPTGAISCFSLWCLDSFWHGDGLSG
jgi:hypothetical protein